jgi:hypothetical protein
VEVPRLWEEVACKFVYLDERQNVAPGANDMQPHDEFDGPMGQS